MNCADLNGLWTDSFKLLWFARFPVMYKIVHLKCWQNLIFHIIWILVIRDKISDFLIPVPVVTWISHKTLKCLIRRRCINDCEISHIQNKQNKLEHMHNELKHVIESSKSTDSMAIQNDKKQFKGEKGTTTTTWALDNISGARYTQNLN